MNKPLHYRKVRILLRLTEIPEGQAALYSGIGRIHAGALVELGLAKLVGHKHISGAYQITPEGRIRLAEELERLHLNKQAKSGRERRIAT